MYLHLDIPLRHRNSLLAAAAAAAAVAVAVAVGNILLVAHLVGFAVGSILFGDMNIAAVEQGVRPPCLEADTASYPDLDKRVHQGRHYYPCIPCRMHCSADDSVQT